MHPDLAVFLSLVPADSRAWQTYDDRRLADGSPRCNRSLSHVRHGPYVRHARLLDRLNAPHIGAAVTISVNPTDGRGRRTSNIASIAAAAADIDRALPAFPLRPSLVVETSPVRYQAWWLLAPGTALTETEYRAVMSALVARGADPAAIDIARVLRVPSFLNNKSPDRPWRVRVVGGTHARYRPSVVVGAFPAPEMAETDRFAPPLSVELPPIRAPTTVSLGSARNTALARLVAPLGAIPADDYRTWIVVGLALHGETGGAPAGLALWEAWSARSSKFQPGVCERRWSTFARSTGPIARAGKIIWLARQNGWRA